MSEAFLYVSLCIFMGVGKTRKGTVINGMKIMRTNTIIHVHKSGAEIHFEMWGGGHHVI